MKTKAELINFLKRFRVTKNQGKLMTEVIQVITELWDEKNMSILLQQIQDWLQTLSKDHGSIYVNQRSLQISIRKWEELAKNKGWITQEDLDKANGQVVEIIKKELAEAKALKDPIQGEMPQPKECCGSKDCECEDDS